MGSGLSKEQEVYLWVLQQLLPGAGGKVRNSISFSFYELILKERGRVKSKTETGFINAMFAAGGISEKVLLIVKEFL